MNEDLVRYRLERSAEALEDAKILLDQKRLHATVNRLYYSMFYAVVALLETQDLKSSKHSGVRALFNQHFVKTKSISKESGDFYGVMYTNRQKGDYVEYTEFTEAHVKGFFTECGLRLDEIRTRINEIMALCSDEK